MVRPILQMRVLLLTQPAEMLDQEELINYLITLTTGAFIVVSLTPRQDLPRLILAQEMKKLHGKLPTRTVTLAQQAYKLYRLREVITILTILF